MEQSSPIVGVILAGGLSRRMGGGDKTLRRLGGRPMLAHVVDRLRPQVDRLVLNANGAPERFAAFGLPVVADPIEGFAGPLAGVLAGMLWARADVPGARFVVSAAADTPFLPADLVARFLAANTGEPRRIVLASSGGHTHPVFGLWPILLAGDLDAALRSGTRKILAWTQTHDCRYADFVIAPGVGAAADPFFNANAPDDLAAAAAFLAAGAR